MNPQLEELACLYVLDRLDARERTSFEASMQTDSELAAFVREIESTLEQRIRALPGLEPPAGLLARIEARVDRLPARLSPEQPRTAAPLWVSISRWGIAALLLLGFGAMEFRHLQRNPAAAARPIVVFVGLDSRQSMLSEVPLRQRPKDADASFVQLASLAEQMWEKPSDLPVKLHSTGQGGRGYALFDPSSSEGFIAVQQLPTAGTGQRYHLWIVDTSSGQTCEAGILPLTDATNGLYFFSVQPGFKARSGSLDFFVTTEKTMASESARPSGKVVLGNQRTF
jgi:hypothetical protein